MPVSRLFFPTITLLCCLSIESASAAQPGTCPPGVRCYPDQLPPPRNDEEFRRKVQAEEGAALEATVRQRETEAIRREAASNLDNERRSAWIESGRLKEPPPAKLIAPIFTLTPSGRVISAGGGVMEIAASTGLRFDGLPLALGRLGFEIEAAVGSRESNDKSVGTLACDASFLWIGGATVLPFARIGSSIGRFSGGPPESTPTGFYRVFIGVGLDNYVIPLGTGRGVGLAFEARFGLFDGYGGNSSEFSKLRSEMQLLLGPRFAF